MDRRGGPSEMILRGIASYARPASSWVLSWDSPRASGIRSLLEMKLDGLLVKHVDAEGVKLIEGSGIPTVNVGLPLQSHKIREVDNDEVAIGKMAASYFLRRGYRNFGYYPRTGNHLDQRGLTFQEELAHHGHICHMLDARPGHPSWPSAHASLKRDNEDLNRWLALVPKPIAVFCVADYHALVVAEYCSELGLRVPDDVAILGVENDTIVCTLASPPLSSIQIAGEKIGFLAAQILEQLILGDQKQHQATLRVPPVRVVSRRSTDAVAAPDPLVARALDYLRAHAANPNCLHDFFAELHYSRRTLERKFRKSTGLSPAEACLRFRLEEAERLLTHTELSVEEVSERSGFSEVRQLQGAFRKVLLQTPTQFRRHAAPSSRAQHAPTRHLRSLARRAADG